MCLCLFSSVCSHREKMICSILPLISLTCCVCGSFVENVTQTSYQAEENHNITLEWMFTTRTDSSPNSLFIYCELSADLRPLVLFRFQEGVEVPESQDEQFAGRVRCDEDVLREGRLRLHVSRLRTDDSGLYWCDVLTGYGRYSGKCWLNVTGELTAAPDEPRPQRPTVSPQPESQGRIGLYVGLGLGLGLTAAALCAGLCFAFRHYFTKSTDKKGNICAVVMSSSEKQPIRTNRTLSGGPPLNESSEYTVVRTQETQDYMK
ncbi:uncharacterized protein LOC119494919 [Sebastes umbrosus]|uniref:uncharacterized protein LOC119494919 n=1 Tax=Sebastes umbrosus TaxID=72105 RepID=UPI00189DB071|nr:uncharacterized protein LOC119494919 [Sebastes umbrosus]